MAAERNPSLQDTFLNHVRENKVPVMTFLVNGVRLQGYVSWSDKFSVQLTRGDSLQIVYKHAISTIVPEGPVGLFAGAEDTNGSP
jgi:host factor-I protein